jgi:high-affinity nickel-transport protein
MFASFGAIALGLLLGLRHAFEPDHLTAVSTLVIETKDARRGALLGAIWGIGHTISLALVGSILLVTGLVLPVRVAAGFELAVAAMLIVLGVLALRHTHDHEPHTHAHVHVGRKTLAWRPLAIGLVHGLAGSGALTALVFSQLPTLATRIVYITLFGVGSIAGMAIASGVAGASLHRAANSPSRRRTLAIVTGALSIGLGIAWAIPELALL